MVLHNWPRSRLIEEIYRLRKLLEPDWDDSGEFGDFENTGPISHFPDTAVLDLDSILETDNPARVILDYTIDWETWNMADGKFMYCSPSCLEITGHSPEEFYGDAGLLEKLIHPEDLPIWNRHNHTKLGKSERITFRIICKNGQEKWLEHICKPVLNNNGEHTGQRASNRDVTANIKTETDLADTLSRMISIADNAPIGICMADREGDLIFASTFWTGITGSLRIESLGRGWLDFIDEEDRASLSSLWDEMVATKVMFEHDVRVLTELENPVWIHVLASPVPNADGREEGFVLFMIDVTSRVDAARREHEILQTLETQNVALEENAIALRRTMEILSVEKKRIQEELVADLYHIVLPMLERLKSRLSGGDAAIINLMQNTIINLSAPFANNLASPRYKLSPKEIEVCNMIRLGKSSKEIAEMLGISFETVRTHRRAIRNKLEMTGQGGNLEIFLRNIEK